MICGESAMNVYDFDGTIYHGDSTIDFYLYCLIRRPKIIFCFPRQLGGTLAYALGKYDKTRWKESFFCFLTQIDDLHTEVCDFWDQHEKKIREWYLDQKQETDVIISASPAFLLWEICRRLKVRHLIASQVDEEGRFSGKNCYGKQKAAYFGERFPQNSIDCFYSDSVSDQPMARLAAAAYLVDGERICQWPFE